ncbi:hypothetical protein [Streptomyces tubercidicus]|uniref:hypothetical protein n=1 Tax=Streptomyces tubercidicus TaxID=47759 RepID=UPI0034652613
MNTTHLNQALITRLTGDSDLAEDIRFYGERYLEHRRLAAAPTIGYTNGYAHAAYGKDLATLLDVTAAQLPNLPGLVEEALTFLDTSNPTLVETVPERPGHGIGYNLHAIAPGAPLPDGRTAVTVEDPLGSSFRVTDDKGTVTYLHKYGQLRRYTTGVVAFLEPDWAGWACN